MCPESRWGRTWNCGLLCGLIPFDLCVRRVCCAATRVLCGGLSLIVGVDLQAAAGPLQRESLVGGVIGDRNREENSTDGVQQSLGANIHGISSAGEGAWPRETVAAGMLIGRRRSE